VRTPTKAELGKIAVLGLEASAAGDESRVRLCQVALGIIAAPQGELEAAQKECLRCTKPSRAGRNPLRGSHLDEDPEGHGGGPLTAKDRARIAGWERKREQANLDATIANRPRPYPGLPMSGLEIDHIARARALLERHEERERHRAAKGKVSQ
jgi:hypothetical protein